MSQSSPTPTYATLEDWLNEIESYGVRAERIPPGAYPWIAEAWKLGAASSALGALGKGHWCFGLDERPD